MVMYRVLQLLLLVSGISSQVIGMMSSEETKSMPPKIERITSEEVSSIPFQVEGIAQKIAELPKELQYDIFSSALELLENPKYEVYIELGVGPQIARIALTKDAKKVLTGSDNGKVYIWDVEKRRIIKVLKGHEDGISSLALSADGTLALTGSKDGMVRIWDILTGETIKTFQVGSRVISVALSADGTLALIGSRINNVHLYNTVTGELLKELKGYTGSIISVALSADASIALGGFAEGEVLIWNTVTGQLIKTLKLDSTNVYAMALSADGSTAVMACGYKALVWDIKTGILLSTPSMDDCICSVAVSKDGKRALTSTTDHKIQLWNTKPLPGQMETTISLTEFKGYAGVAYPVAFGDNDLIASGLSHETFAIWKPFALKPEEPRENKEVLWQTYKEIFSKPKFLYPDKK